MPQINSRRRKPQYHSRRKGTSPKAVKNSFYDKYHSAESYYSSYISAQGHYIYLFFLFPGHIFPGCQIYMSSAAGKYNAKGSKNNSQKHTDKIHNISPFSLMLFPSSEKQYKKSAVKIPWPKPCDFLAEGQEKTAENYRRS